jgi:uncharacterized protein Veg
LFEKGDPRCRRGAKEEVYIQHECEPFVFNVQYEASMGKWATENYSCIQILTAEVYLSFNYKVDFGRLKHKFMYFVKQT